VKKIGKFEIFRGNFPNRKPKPKVADRTQPEQQKIDPTCNKIFDPDPYHKPFKKIKSLLYGLRFLEKSYFFKL